SSSLWLGPATNPSSEIAMLNRSLVIPHLPPPDAPTDLGRTVQAAFGSRAGSRTPGRVSHHGVSPVVRRRAGEAGQPSEPRSVAFDLVDLDVVPRRGSLEREPPPVRRPGDPLIAPA